MQCAIISGGFLSYLLIYKFHHKNNIHVYFGNQRINMEILEVVYIKGTGTLTLLGKLNIKYQDLSKIIKLRKFY